MTVSRWILWSALWLNVYLIARNISERAWLLASLQSAVVLAQYVCLRLLPIAEQLLTARRDKALVDLDLAAYMLAYVRHAEATGNPLNVDIIGTTKTRSH